MPMASVTVTAGVSVEAPTTTKEIDGYSKCNCDGNCDCVGDGNTVPNRNAESVSNYNGGFGLCDG